jgi:hypothetical protein
VSWRVPALIIALGLIIRIAWFFTPAGSPDADEAVFGLMALHIQEGREYPLYCWGAHYAGAVVSYLAALGFWAFGMGAIELKSATLPFAAGYLAVTYGLARLVFDDRSALVALLVAAVPPAIALDISVKATGGYPETLCFGGLVLLLAFLLPNAASSSARLRGHLFLLGFAGGFGFYILPLILPYLAVVLLYLIRHYRFLLWRGAWDWIAMGGLLGVSPMLIYNLQFPGATVLRLGSHVLDVSRAEVLDSGFGVSAVAGWIVRYLSELPIRLATLVQNVGPLLGLGMTGGAMLAWIVLTGAGLALYFHPGKNGHLADAKHLGRWCAGLFLCALLFAWISGLNRPRHLAPLYSVLPLGIAALYARMCAVRPWIAHASLAALVLTAGWGLARSAPQPRVKPVEPLVQAMQQHGIRGLYADYEIAYLVMFFSRESVLASPTAWTQAPGLISDRTPDITRQVDRFQAPAYVFFRKGPEATWFAEGLARRNIAFDRQTRGDFEVFMGLSMPVRSGAFPVGQAW